MTLKSQSFILSDYEKAYCNQSALNVNLIVFPIKLGNNYLDLAFQVFTQDELYNLGEPYMDRSQWDVIILKPTSVFLSFLSAQYPEVDLTEQRLTEADTTAYVIRRQPSEEATLDEVERHYPFMFKHEMNRWFGEGAHNNIESSFLDFLCCFKFELHSQILLMEPSMKAGRNLLCIKPRSILLKWLRASIEDDDELTSILERVNLSHLVENATVVVKNFKQAEDVEPFINQYYRSIFKAEMSRMCDKEEQWPIVNSVQTFNRYFTVEMHTHVVHLH